MPRVIDPKKEIEDYLQSQGYLPFNSNNSPEDTHNAIIEGAARFVNNWEGVGFNAEGCCWAQNVTKTESVLTAAVEAVGNIKTVLSCDYSSGKSIMSEIVRKSKELCKK